ncbi:MAG: DUF2971 domain-containing protein [Bacteroidota bacterium]
MSLRFRNVKQEKYNLDDLTLEEYEDVIPDRLYKYFTLNTYSKDTLKNNRLYYSKPSSFNDPFDCRIKMNVGDEKSILNTLKLLLGDVFLKNNLSAESLNSLISNPEGTKRVLNEIILHALDENLGVCCFSELATSPLMWAHYADSHKGFCLEFDPKKEPNIGKKLVPVIYHEDYPEFNLQETKKSDLQGRLYRLIASKSDDWDYEFEWRAIVTPEGGKLYEFSKESLTGVLYGLKTSDEDKNEIHELIKSCNYGEVDFLQVHEVADSYRIDISTTQR